MDAVLADGYGGLIMVANNPSLGDYAVSAMYDVSALRNISMAM